VKDKGQVAKLEQLLNTPGVGPKQVAYEIKKDLQVLLRLLEKPQKSLQEYNKLCIKDGKLTFRAMDYGTSLRYTGQVRMMAVYSTDDPSGPIPPEGAEGVMDYEYVKCGYGKMLWPDESSFEGYWINNVPCGVGIFRAPAPSHQAYQGFWAKDRQTNLSVFRQNHGSDIEADLEAIERHSDLTSL